MNWGNGVKMGKLCWGVVWTTHRKFLLYPIVHTSNSDLLPVGTTQYLSYTFTKHLPFTAIALLCAVTMWQRDTAQLLHQA